MSNSKVASSKKGAKKIVGYIKLQIQAGKATASPPIGPALGQKGLNIMEFCKAFNERTKSVNPSWIMRVVITVYSDKTFEFEVKTPPASFLIKEAAGIQKGSAKPNADKVGKISMSKLEEIAKLKIADFNTDDIKNATKILAGSALSMGLKIE